MALTLRLTNFVDVGYIPDIKYDFTQWGGAQGASAATGMNGNGYADAEFGEVMKSF